jgi:hypothetical protein
MEPLLAVAAGLIVAVAVAHSWLGERYIIVRLLRRDDLPSLFGADTFTRRTIRYAWHLTTVAWLGLAAALLVVEAPVAASSVGRGVVLTVGATFVASAFLALVTTRGRHLSWIVFLAVAVLCGVVAL